MVLGPTPSIARSSSYFLSCISYIFLILFHDMENGIRRYLTPVKPSSLVCPLLGLYEKALEIRRWLLCKVYGYTSCLLALPCHHVKDFFLSFPEDCLRRFIDKAKICKSCYRKKKGLRERNKTAPRSRSTKTSATTDPEQAI